MNRYAILSLALVVLLAGCIAIPPTPDTSPTPTPARTLTPAPTATPFVAPTNTPAHTATPGANFLPYENSARGIRMMYPANWEKLENVMGSIVAFRSPQEGASDRFREGVNVVTEDLPAGVTLDAYTNVSLTQLRNIITDFNLTESSPTTLSGNPAQKIVYTGKQGTYDLKFMQVLCVKGGKGYVISYVAEASEFSAYSQRAQQIIDSFEFTQ